MNIQEFTAFIVRHVGWIVPLPLLIGIYRKKYMVNELQTILFFSCNNVFFEITSRIMSLYKISNLHLFHLYVITEFFFISWFYYKIFEKYISPKIIPAIFVTFVIFSLIDSFILHNILTFNSYAKTVECLIIVGYTVFYLYKTFDEFQDQDPSETPVFWINAGFLLYYSGCLFLFTFSNFILTQGRSIGMITWALHAFFVIINYVLMSMGLWKSTT